MGIPQLRVLFWETTSACNLRCRHCRRGEARAAAGPGELSAGEALGLIRGIASWSRPLLVLSGGEPLMRPDIADLAACASACGLPVALATNGTMADRRAAERLRDAGVRRASVSIDGASAAVHDRLRGAPGAFDAAREGLRTLRDAGLPVQVNMTVCRSTRAEVERVFRLAASEGACAVHLFVLVPVGCGLALAGEEGLSPAEREEFLSWFRARGGTFGVEARLTCAPQYARLAAERGRGAGGAGSGCLCGRSVCFVSSEGEVYPCGYLPVSAGNARRGDLRAIWERSPLFESLRSPERLGPPCGACRHRDVCGGCRARAYAATGDYLAGEKECAG